MILQNNLNRKGRMELTNRKWSIMGQEYYYKLPMYLRTANKISKFKKGLREWISNYIPIAEAD